MTKHQQDSELDPDVVEAGVKRAASHWHIDRSIPIALIVGLIAQFAYFSYNIGRAESQLTDHERRIIVVEAQRVAERLNVLEVQTLEIKAVINRMDTKLDKMVERQLSNHGSR